ncbi:MAG: hypothetical protein EOM05_05200 [Clostridia bacterium]|nr:hypothetical protein [Clostridia bacterium]
MFDDKVKVADEFQTSVNIAYDLYDKCKIERFIPTQAAIEIIEDIMLSTAPKSTRRARMFVGAYGRGKSHIVLVALSLLFYKDKDVFNTILDSVKKYSEELYEYVSSYIESDKKILPVIISGSSASLSQSFMFALQQTLKREGLNDVLPETHYQAAINAIKNWKTNYPTTYERFIDILGMSADEFIIRLSNFEPESFERFKHIYPELTSGSEFNPFGGFDVAEIYDEVNNQLVKHGYSGMYIVYDEFSKYLESSISNATISDIKLLQDFAEKCNRSAEKQMHLMLICHKDISNYIDANLPKEKVDGWRGVSGRFAHTELRNNFSQIYEVIGAAISKEPQFWNEFCQKNRTIFEGITNRAFSSGLFDSGKEGVDTIVKECYPLHPYSTFILPRVSEKVAQNERTLFTFLSADEKYTLKSFLTTEQTLFPLLTVDTVYDYFEPLLRKEVYTSDIYKLHKLASVALQKVEQYSLEAKIIKFIALIYVVEQFEKLAPTVDTIVSAFADSYPDVKAIHSALKNLIDNECVVYLKRSNNFLRLKESSGVDVSKEIEKRIAVLTEKKSVVDILNGLHFDYFIYPTKYNDEHEITRYFDFIFVTGESFEKGLDFSQMLSYTEADGLIIAVVPISKEELSKINKMVQGLDDCDRVVVAIPRTYSCIEKIALEYAAAYQLQEETINDDLLHDEYAIYVDDLEEVVADFISSFIKPESNKAVFYHLGKAVTINRKAQLSSLLSNICDKAFPYTPIINNESINKNQLPTVAINSRTKLLNGILSEPLLANLGLAGSGQDVSMMRSTLLKTGIVQNIDDTPVFTLNTQDENIDKVLSTIEQFFLMAAKGKNASFSDLYDQLINARYGIGLKKGVIPIFVAVVLRKYVSSVSVLLDGKEQRINGDLLSAINEKPFAYDIRIDSWDADKEEYICRIEELFLPYIIEQEKSFNNLSYITTAMNRWYQSLPKYSKELTEFYLGTYPKSVKKTLSASKKQFINAIKQVEVNPHQFLFEDVLGIFGMSSFSLDVIDNIRSTKEDFDAALTVLIDAVSNDIRFIFGGTIKGCTTVSAAKNWFESLSTSTIQYLFANNENQVLSLIELSSNDDSQFTQRLAKAITSLRMEDWTRRTIDDFISSLIAFKKTVDEYNMNAENSTELNSNAYKIVFTDENGTDTVRSFERVEFSKKAKLLQNEIKTSLEEMGQSITEQEKRQVLIELLKELC